MVDTNFWRRDSLFLIPSLQFSITPYLMFLFSPGLLLRCTYAIFASIGYFLIYNYIQNHTEWVSVAISAACVFTTNGYFLNHILVGHLNYCSFTMIAVVPYIISSSWSAKKCIIVISGCVVYDILSGFSYRIFVLFITGTAFLLYHFLNKNYSHLLKYLEFLQSAIS